MRKKKKKKNIKNRLIEQSPFICEASIAAHDGIICLFLVAKLSTFGQASLHVLTPEIGQLQGALSQLLRTKELLHHVCGLGLC